MKLRNHPSVKWPPTWTRIDGEGDKNITGELGILGSTSPSRVEPTAICYLLMDFQDSTYMGKLRFGDGAVCEQVLELLQQQYGHPVQQIGDLELTEATTIGNNVTSEQGSTGTIRPATQGDDRAGNALNRSYGPR